MRLHLSTTFSALAVIVALIKHAHAQKEVFGHYMVGTVTPEHARKDIDDAIAAGLTGFSLNIGAPSQPFVIDTLNALFDYAPTVNFSLHISMDVSASGGDPNAFNNIVRGYVGKPGYYQATPGRPFITTFGDGGRTNTDWNNWKSSTLANQLYFCPDFDGTAGYTTSDPGWWAYWGNTVDCLLSWEPTWQRQSSGSAGSVGPGSIEVDQTVLAGAKSHGKGYFMGLSPLQYKNAYGANVYRPGELTLVTRMKNILTMSPKPDYIDVITWNDGPESHYVGNLWPESNGDPEPARYSGPGATWSHSAWQPLIASFSDAFLHNKGPDAMSVPSRFGGPALGALWYKTVLQSSQCPNGDHPSAYQLGQDVVNWAVVVNPGTSTANYVLSVFNGAQTTNINNLKPGLNFGQVPVVAGTPSMQLKNGATALYSTSGGRAVSSGCPDGIFNMNYVVVGLNKA